jgi:hypothetical protein
VLMSDATKSKEFAIESGTHAADGAGHRRRGRRHGRARCWRRLRRWGRASRCRESVW